MVVDTPHFLVLVRLAQHVNRGIHEGLGLRETAGDGEACGCGIVELAQEVGNACRSWQRINMRDGGRQDNECNDLEGLHRECG